MHEDRKLAHVLILIPQRRDTRTSCSKESPKQIQKQHEQLHLAEFRQNRKIRATMSHSKAIPAPSPYFPSVLLPSSCRFANDHRQRSVPNIPPSLSTQASVFASPVSSSATKSVAYWITSLLNPLRLSIWQRLLSIGA